MHNLLSKSYHHWRLPPPRKVSKRDYNPSTTGKRNIHDSKLEKRKRKTWPQPEKWEPKLFSRETSFRNCSKIYGSTTTDAGGGKPSSNNRGFQEKNPYEP
ncbi:hypothetical protein V6N13_091170 [Hibiscus sabdariffa]